MKVQFPVRFVDEGDRDPEEEQLRRLVDGEEALVPIEEKYTYGDIIMDTRDIRIINRLDDKNSVIRTYHQDMFVIPIPFNDLKLLVIELTGENITVVRSFRVEEEKPEEEKKKKRKKKDDNDFLTED